MPRPWSRFHTTRVKRGVNRAAYVRFVGDDSGTERSRRAWWRRRAARTPESEVVADAEALLLGHLVDRLERRGDSVPVWAWTNLLAHGTLAELITESNRSRPGGAAAHRQWRYARSYLAAEVLDYAKLSRSLADVQRVVLVPLELKLASSPAAADWRPSQWALAVECALARRHQVGRPG